MVDWIAFLLLQLLSGHSDGKCVFYGQCDTYQGLLGEVGVPCAVDMDPVPINDTTGVAQETMKKICGGVWDAARKWNLFIPPNFWYVVILLIAIHSYTPAAVNAKGEKLFCCDPGQIQNIQSNLEIPGTLMSRCPSCYRNFREYTCQLPCSPYQSDFIKVTNVDNSK